MSARGKYLATAFLISSNRRRYGELVLLLKNDYVKQQKNYPKTLKYMYGLMVAFKPTRPTPVSGGRNEGINFGNVAVKPGTGGDADHSDGGCTGRNIECWCCGGGPHEKILSKTRLGQRRQRKYRRGQRRRNHRSATRRINHRSG